MFGAARDLVGLRRLSVWLKIYFNRTLVSSPFHLSCFPTTTIPQDDAMQHSSSSSLLRQQFAPLLPPNNRSRQYSAPSPTSLNASIWAPHAQSAGGTWPRDVPDLTDPLPLHARQQDYSLPSSAGAHPAFDGRLPPGNGPDFSAREAQSKPMAIGAIGEGRARDSQLHRETEVSFFLL